MQATTQPLAIRSTRKGELTAERILDAAEELFAERGFSGTTLRDVAGSVGLRTPSLYNHFASKEALYSAVLERGLRPVLEVLGRFIETGDPGDRGLDLVQRVMKLVARRPHLPRLIQYEVLTGGARLSPMLRSWIGPVLENARTLIERTPSARQWRAEEIPLLVLAMYHSIIGLFTIAPLYEDLSGVDLLSDEAFDIQTRFFERFVEALLPDVGSTPDTNH